MANTVTRLSNTGILLINGSFDEVSYNTSSTFRTTLTANTLYTTKEFDEVTYDNTSIFRQRINNEGSYFVTGMFDEVTGFAKVPDGLIGYYDPAYSTSYPGSGSNLYNMVDGVAATLNGTYAANTEALGTSISGFQNVRLTNNDPTPTNNISHIQLTNLTNVTTVSIWFYQHTYASGAKYILDGRTGGSGGWIYNSSVGTNWDTGVVYVNGGASSGTPLWANWNGTETGVWKNVTFIADTPMTDDLNIFSRYSDNEGMDVTFGPILIYNRAITQEENRQNFNALRNRYGI